MNDKGQLYGGFVISKSILAGKPVRFSFREESSIPELNGWNLYSCDDDEEYISDPNNFQIVGVDTIDKYAPQLLDIFNAPYGTDLCWLYKQRFVKYVTFIGFYDLCAEREVTVQEILGQ